MKIGLTELLLILCIVAVAAGPAIAGFVRRWRRRARRAYKRAERSRAVAAIELRAEADEVMHRFRLLGIAMAAAMVLVPAYALLLRPAGADPVPYTAPTVSGYGTAKLLENAESFDTGDYKAVACVRENGGMIYFAAKAPGGGSAIVRANPDGSGLGVILTCAEEITAFDFAPDNALWFATVSEEGGALCRAGYDGWGAAAERIVTQIDGRALSCPAAVAVGADGSVYFTDAAAVPAESGAEGALQTELIAHTATGWVYVYDPAARTVQRVMGGIAGAAGLALAPDGAALYVSDMGSRCVWAIDPAARELVAGGRGCRAFAAALPGCPGALCVDEAGCVYVSYRWAVPSWLEAHSGGTLLRRAALRLPRRWQAGLFAAPNPCAGCFGPAGSLNAAFGGVDGGAGAVYVCGNRVYIGSARGGGLKYIRI